MTDQNSWLINSKVLMIYSCGVKIKIMKFSFVRFITYRNGFFWLNLYVSSRYSTWSKTIKKKALTSETLSFWIIFNAGNVIIFLGILSEHILVVIHFASNAVQDQEIHVLTV